MYGMAPTISDLISEALLVDILRSSDSLSLKYSSCKSLATLGDRSFYMASPTIWNDLPGPIRSIKSANSFTKALKTYLFTNAC